MTGDGQLREWLDRLAKLGGVISAGEAIVADAEQILFRHACGFRVGGEALTAASGARFDAASLTKPWMATLALALDRGAPGPPPRRLALDEQIEAGSATATGADGATLSDLLRHRAGMPAWTPLAVRLGRRLADPAALKALLANPEAIASRPFNERLASLPGVAGDVVYSDLGYLLWGVLAEERLEAPLATLLDRQVCAPLGIEGLGSLSLEGDLPDAVECRLDNGKEVELAAAQGLALGRQQSHLRGVPQDGNARALRAAGRLGAHAGLFVSADEMLALGREWLHPGRLLSAAQVAAALAGDGDYALGWARWSELGSSGPALSRASFGHSGFTGGSLWIDPERRRIFLLLAHRLSSAVDFNPFRREFHRLAGAL